MLKRKKFKIEKNVQNKKKNKKNGWKVKKRAKWTSNYKKKQLMELK